MPKGDGGQIGTIAPRCLPENEMAGTIPAITRRSAVRDYACEMNLMFM
jgi:hypothetical protein